MASSCTCTPSFHSKFGREICVLTFAWTAHTDGTFDSVTTDDYTFGSRTLTQIVAKRALFGGKTIPGATAPTDQYNVSVVDSDSDDMFDKLLYARSNANTETEKTAFPRLVEGAITIDITSNSVNGATGTVKLYFY